MVYFGSDLGRVTICLASVLTVNFGRTFETDVHISLCLWLHHITVALFLLS